MGVFNGCEVLIENSITRVTVRLHEACRVMPNSYPSDGIQFAPMNHYRFFFLHTLPSTIAFRLEYVLFYQLYAKITTFFYQETFGTAPLLYVCVETFDGNWHENDITTSKMMSKHKIVKLTSCMRVILHPWCKTTFPSSCRVHGNPGRVCKK